MDSMFRLGVSKTIRTKKNREKKRERERAEIKKKERKNRRKTSGQEIDSLARHFSGRFNEKDFVFR